MKKVRIATEVRAKLTSKGQVTIPSQVRKALGIDTGDQVIFAICDDGSVTMRSPRYPTLASLVGAAGTLPPGTRLDDADISRVLEQEITERYLRKLASGDA